MTSRWRQARFLARAGVLSLAILTPVLAQDDQAEPHDPPGDPHATTDDPSHSATDDAVECDVCHDAELAPCPSCDGSGKQEIRCDHCSGRGRVACDVRGCKSGFKPCRTCDGKGYGVREFIGVNGGGGRRRIPCGTCDRTGRVKCYSCDDDGHERCPRCRGRKTTAERCEHCEGKRKVSCPECTGAPAGTATGNDAAGARAERLEPPLDEDSVEDALAVVHASKRLLSRIASLHERADELHAPRQKISARRRQLEGYLGQLALPPRPESRTARRAHSRVKSVYYDIHDEWKRYQQLHEGLMPRLQVLDEGLAELVEAKQEIDAVRVEAMEILDEKDAGADEISDRLRPLRSLLRQKDSRRERVAEQLATLSGRVAYLSTRLDRIDAAIAELDGARETLGVAVTAARNARMAKEAQRREQFARVAGQQEGARRRLEREAEALGFASATAIWEAEVERSANDTTPTLAEEALSEARLLLNAAAEAERNWKAAANDALAIARRLEELIDTAFDSVRELEVLRLELHAAETSSAGDDVESGQSPAAAFQRFKVQREEWQEQTGRMQEGEAGAWKRLRLASPDPPLVPTDDIGSSWEISSGLGWMVGLAIVAAALIFAWIQFSHSGRWNRRPTYD